MTFCIYAIFGWNFIDKFCFDHFFWQVDDLLENISFYLHSLCFELKLLRKIKSIWKLHIRRILFALFHNILIGKKLWRKPNRKQNCWDFIVYSNIFTWMLGSLDQIQLNFFFLVFDFSISFVLFHGIWFKFLNLSLENISFYYQILLLVKVRYNHNGYFSLKSILFLNDQQSLSENTPIDITYFYEFV